MYDAIWILLIGIPLVLGELGLLYLAVRFWKKNVLAACSAITALIVINLMIFLTVYLTSR